MMHDVMQDARDLAGRSRAREPLRCDPLLRISLQSSAHEPIYASTLDLVYPNSRFAVVQPNGRFMRTERQNIVWSQSFETGCMG
jgi:hypothetical protein